MQASTMDMRDDGPVPAPSGVGARGRVRPFRRYDIRRVVALRQQVFRRSERPSEESLAAHFESVFFGSPWADRAFPSLVYEDEQGQLGGFVGVLPRPMRFRGESLRTVVTTQFMVASRAGPLVAAQLVRTVLAGSQDLTLADAANDTARRVLMACGGSTAWAYSMVWAKPLRPVRHALGRWRRGSLAWAAGLAARPFAHALDAVTGRPPRPRNGSIEPLDVTAMAATLPELTATRSLRPCYDAASLDWLLRRAAEKASLGTLQRVQVRDAGGRLVGWFLYFLNPGGVSQVVQIAARPDAARAVLEHLWYHAWSGGAVALEGRVEPTLLPELVAQECRLARQGSWVLCHSPRLEVELAIHRGDAFLSRLEGEWWLSF